MKALLSVDVSQTGAEGADVDTTPNEGGDPNFHFTGDVTE
jgi:hypothetical protein